MADQPQSFWSSLQGILTAFAGVITAITGLYIAMNGDNSDTQAGANDVEITTQLQTQDKEATTTKPDKTPTRVIQTTPQTITAQTVTNSVKHPVPTKAPFPATGPLVNCAVFPTVNSVSSLMSWSNNYHKQIIAADGVKRRATDPCNKTIDYRGMAHCKVPDDAKIRQALLDTLTLCRAAGIEWQDIQHSTIIGRE